MQVRGFRLLHRVVAVEKRPGLDLRLDLLDPLEAVSHQLGGGNAALANVRRSLGERQGVEAHTSSEGGSAPLPIPPPWGGAGKAGARTGAESPAAWRRVDTGCLIRSGPPSCGPRGSARGVQGAREPQAQPREEGD